MTIFSIALDLTDTEIETVEFLALGKPEDADFGSLFVALWNEIGPDVPFLPEIGDFIQYEDKTDLGTWYNNGDFASLNRVEAHLGTDVVVSSGFGWVRKISVVTWNFRLEERTVWSTPDFDGDGNTYHQVYPETLDSDFDPEVIDDGSGGGLLDDGDEG